MWVLTVLQDEIQLLVNVGAFRVKERRKKNLLKCQGVEKSLNKDFASVRPNSNVDSLPLQF